MRLHKNKWSDLPLYLHKSCILKINERAFACEWVNGSDFSILMQLYYETPRVFWKLNDSNFFQHMLMFMLHPFDKCAKTAKCSNAFMWNSVSNMHLLWILKMTWFCDFLVVIYLPEQYQPTHIDIKFVFRCVMGMALMWECFEKYFFHLEDPRLLKLIKLVFQNCEHKVVYILGMWIIMLFTFVLIDTFINISRSTHPQQYAC